MVSKYSLVMVQPSMNLKTDNRAATRSWTYSGHEPQDRLSEAMSFLNDPALDMLVARLLTEQLSEVRDSALRQRLRRAAAESASIAWSTPYPLLALPELFAEKEREARSQHERQQTIQRRNRAPLAYAE